jgi:hypothetical protein
MKKLKFGSKAYRLKYLGQGKKTKTRKVQTMARKRFYGKKGKGMLGKAINILVGAGVAALYEVFISPRIPLARNIKNILEMVIGIVLMMMPKIPMAIRAGGAALATINAFEIIVPLMQGLNKTSSAKGSMANI